MAKQTFEELQGEIGVEEPTPITFSTGGRQTFEQLQDEVVDKPVVPEAPTTPPWFGITPIREDAGQTLGVPRTQEEKEAFDHDSALKMARDTRMPYGLVRDNYPELADNLKIFQQFTDDGFDIRMGLAEDVQRMDALDYADRFVLFWPGKAVEWVELKGATKRLQEDTYEELRVPVGHITEQPQTAQKMRAADVKMVENYFLWQDELAFRGQTGWSKLFGATTHLPKYMIEFLMTGGLKQLGSVTAKNMAVRILRQYTQSPGGRTTLRAVGWIGGAVTRASLGLTHHVVEETFKRKLPKQVKFGPNDEFTIVVEGENWASSVIKGWADVVIEAASEEAGAEISKHLMGLMKKMPFGKKIFDGLYTAWFERHQKTTVVQFYNEFFTKAGYSNIVGEIGEERLGTILRAVLHTESFGLPDDAPLFDRLSAGLSADLNNFPIEVLVLTIPGATRYVGGKIISKFDNPTMDIVNRYNKKIKVAQKRGDTDAVKSLKVMEQYELAQLAKPVFTAYQEMERAKPFEEKAEAITTVPEPTPTGRKAEIVPVTQPEVVFDLSTIESRKKVSISMTTRATEIAKKLGFDVSSDELLTTVSEGKHTRGTSHGDAGISLYIAKGATQEQIDRVLIHELGHTMKPTTVKGIANQYEYEKAAQEFEEKQIVKLKEIEVKAEPVVEEGKISSVSELSKRADAAFKQNDLDAMRDVVQDSWDLPETPEAKVLAKRIQILDGEMLARAREAEPPELDIDNFNQSLLDDGATDALQTSRAYLGIDQPTDIDLPDPASDDIGFIKDILHKIGYREKHGYQPLSEKDYRMIWRFLQMPLDVKHSFPQFGPVFDVQRAAEVNKTILDNRFAEITLPYFQLKEGDRTKIDKALINAGWNEALLYGPKRLKELGLNKKQIEGFIAIRTGLDFGHELLLQKFRDNGVSEKVIEDFSRKIKNYIPHKWYGRWVNIAFSKTEKDEAGKPKVLFMTKTQYVDRFTERDRVKKLYPDARVETMESKKLPREMFEAAPAHAVFQVLDKITKEAEINEDTKAIMQEALSDFYKSKGFASHYIRRKNIPGFTEDLHRPLAEYFKGLTSYLTMIDKVKAFPEALAYIDGGKTPNLYSYTSDYIKYVLGEQQEFAPAKQVAYYYYLYANIKSTAMQLTQNLILGWPELSKSTNFSLAYMLQAMPRVATHTLTSAEKKLLKDMEARGYLETQLSMEISGYAGKPMYLTKGKKVLNMGDIFRHGEKFNRQAMAVALFDSGMTDLEEINDAILAAHFLYGKGNRPTLMRGPISPLMTFRSFGINYATWVKNEIKAGRISTQARSYFALVLFGGLKALPGFAAIVFVWRKLFGTDLEGDAREALKEIAGDKIGGPAGRIAFRGVPAEVLDISFTGAVSPVEIPTDFRELGGVFADQGQRVANVYRDLRIGDYKRALEEASPEALRNPQAAYRMYTQGIRNRSGKQVVDLETGEPLKATAGEAARKALGFQPTKMAEQWDINRFVKNKELEKSKRMTRWADIFFLAVLNEDLPTAEQVVNDILTHNAAMSKRGRKADTYEVTPGGNIPALDSRLKERQRIANLPSTSLIETLIKMRNQYYD